MMCSLRHAWLVTLVFVSTKLLPSVECSENDLVTTEGAVHRCYWCGPGAEQVHRSRRAGPCSAEEQEEQIDCDPGFPYCAIVATAPPQIISKKCVKDYQDDCYTRYCKTSQLWKLTCPCKGDFCNGPITEREKTALSELMGKFNKGKRSIQNVTDINNVEATAIISETSISVMNFNKENENLDTNEKNKVNLDNKQNENFDTTKKSENFDTNTKNENVDTNKAKAMEEEINVQQRIVNDNDLNKDLDQISSSVNSFMNQYPIDNIVPKETKEKDISSEMTVPTIVKTEASINAMVTEKPSITIVKPSSMPPIESLQQTITPTTMNNDEKVSTTTIMTTQTETETTVVTTEKKPEENHVIVTTVKPKKVKNQSGQLVANVSVLIVCIVFMKNV